MNDPHHNTLHPIVTSSQWKLVAPSIEPPTAEKLTGFYRCYEECLQNLGHKRTLSSVTWQVYLIPYSNHPHWTSLKISKFRSRALSLTSFSSSIVRQIHGPSPVPDFHIFVSYLGDKLLLKFPSLKYAKATMYHQTHYYVTQESLRSPWRRGICRPIPYPPTCLICSCQETSFKPRHRGDSPCPRIHTPCNRYSYGVF